MDAFLNECAMDGTMSDPSVYITFKADLYGDTESTIFRVKGVLRK